MIRIRFNKETKVWDHLDKDEPESDLDIRIDGIRLKYLDRVKKDLKNDLDHVEIICGNVGSGKSTLARLDCRYVSNEKFHPTTHIIRHVKDIKTVIKNAKKGDAILIDEGSGIFSGTDTMTKKTKYANYILDVCRQKNLLIVISAPWFHRLTASLAVDRAITLTRVYIHSKTNKRGHFAFYRTHQKEKLYRYAKANFGSLKGVKPQYRGNFGEDFTYTEEYLKLKDETLNIALDSFGDDKEEVIPLTPAQVIQQYRVDLIGKNMDKTVETMAEMLNVSKRTINRLKKEYLLGMSLKSPNLTNTEAMTLTTSDIVA